LPENQFGADRILGRSTVLMKHVSAFTPGDLNRPYFGLPKGQINPPSQLDPDQYLWPFDYRSLGFTFDSDALKPPLGPAGGSDVAPVSIEDFRAAVDNAYNRPSNFFAGFQGWYVPMEDYFETAPPSSMNTKSRITRFHCMPTITRPIDEKQLSMTAPYFLGHCTQFIVEYAGDFLNQQEYDPGNPDPLIKIAPPGAVIGAASYIDSKDSNDPPTIYTGQTDGKIDYIVDTSADLNDPPNDPTKWVRRIRWYGLPRDVNGDGKITINDVVPLKDVLRYSWKGPKGKTYKPGTFDPRDASNNPFAGAPMAPWEKVWPVPMFDDTGILKDATIPPIRGNEDLWQQNYGLYPIKAAANFAHVCAWRNDAPLMIRVLVKIDDPTGKLQDGQWYEYVFSR
jgi:hypothetical protein